jgi:sulfide dehydrogenase cytochrome subunit
MPIKNNLPAALLLLLSAGASWSQDSATLHNRALAATCANCHGTEGKTVDGSAIPSLVGMPKSYMIMQMNAFKDGSRPATVMHQISKGITNEQVERLANYFAATKR